MQLDMNRYTFACRLSLYPLNWCTLYVVARDCDLIVYTVSQKNDTDVEGYIFNAHQPILIVFGRDVGERVCY